MNPEYVIDSSVFRGLLGERLVIHLESGQVIIGTLTAIHRIYCKENLLLSDATVHNGIHKVTLPALYLSKGNIIAVQSDRMFTVDKLFILRKEDLDE